MGCPWGWCCGGGEDVVGLDVELCVDLLHELLDVVARVVVREVHPTSITADELALLAAATSLRRLELTYAAANVHNGCHVAGSHAEAEPMEVRCRRLALIAVRYMCASQPPCVGRLNYSVQEMRRTLPQCTVAELGA